MKLPHAKALAFLTWAIGLLIATAGLPAAAHFSEGMKTQTIILSSEGDALLAFVSIPAPLLFADVVVDAQAQQRPLDTSFAYLSGSDDGPTYYLSMAAIEREADAFADRLARLFEWEQYGQPVPATALDWRLSSEDEPVPFMTPESARSVLAMDDLPADPDFGSAIVDAMLRLDASAHDGPIVVRSALPALQLSQDVTIDNHIVDARGETSRSFTMPGQLTERVTIDGSVLRTVMVFVEQGVLHILKGLDHVLLVVCLALGTGAVFRLIWLVTAFTIGHSITLVATFLGTVPDWPWFIPLVETVIAASVLYAAFMAWRKSMGSVWIIAGIGLIHGLGFSFVLGDILGRQSSDLVLALASFNVGIEVGQVAILALTLVAAFVLSRVSSRVELATRLATLAGIGAVSAYWVMDRSLSIV